MSKLRITALTAEPRTVADVKEIEITPWGKARPIINAIEKAREMVGQQGTVTVEFV